LANTIQIKRSSTASDTPSASDLSVGELAVNTADAKLFTKHSDGTVKEISSGGSFMPLSGGTFTGDVTMTSGEQIIANSNGTLPVLDIGGGGPNFMRYRDGSDYSSTTNGVDIVYRTSPNNLLIERAENANKMAEFGGSDGHVKLFYNNTDRLETTSTGITFTDDLTLTGANYNVVWDASDDALEFADNAKLKFGAGDDMEIYSDGTNGVIDTNNLIIQGDDTDSRPAVYLRSNNTSDVADFDTTSIIFFQAPNSASETTTYNEIYSITRDVTDGSEDGRIQFNQMKAGSSTATYIFDNDALYFSAENQLIWYQYNGSFNTSLYPITPTLENRTIRLPDRNGLVRVVDQQTMTANLAVGWQTIAVFQGRDDSPQGSNQRFHAKFSLIDITSSRHQAMTFYAQSLFANDQGLQIIANSTFGTDVVTAIRIKVSTDANKTYAGAVIQVYVADATNNLVLFLDEANLDDNEGGSSYGNVILKTGIADAIDPQDVGYSTATYSTFAESVQIGTDSIEAGGIGATGNLLTQSNIVLEGATADAHETIITATDATADRTITLPDATGTVLTTGNSDTPTTTTSSSDADFVLVDDGGTMKKITPANLGIGGGGGGSVAADDITTGDAAVSIATTSGNITIDAQGGDTDIIFKGTDSTSDITALTLDMSAAGKAIFNAGSTFADDVTITSDGVNGSANLMLNNSETSNNFGKAIEAYRSGIGVGQRHQIMLGKDASNYDTSTLSFYYAGSGSTSNRFEIGFWNADSLLNVVADGKVGIGKTEPATTLDVNGTVTATSFIGNTPATAYYDSYISADQDLGTSFAALDFQTNRQNVGSVFTESGGEVTVSTAGTYMFSYQVTIGQSATASRTEAAIKMQKKPSGGSYSDIAGTLSNTYNRNNAQDATTASASIIFTVTANDVFQVVAERSSGSGTVKAIANGGRFNIFRIA